MCCGSSSNSTSPMSKNTHLTDIVGSRVQGVGCREMPLPLHPTPYPLLGNAPRMTVREQIVGGCRPPGACGIVGEQRAGEVSPRLQNGGDEGPGCLDLIVASEKRGIA